MLTVTVYPTLRSAANEPAPPKRITVATEICGLLAWFSRNTAGRNRRRVELLVNMESS